MKYKLKLVRPDVAIGDMFSLSESGLISPPTISRQTKRNLKNTVQVKFNERWVGKTAEEIEAEEEAAVDCTPVGNASYSTSGTHGYQVRSDDWHEFSDPPQGDAADGCTVFLRIPVSDAHYDTYGAYDTDEVSIKLSCVNGYSTTVNAGYSGTVDPDDLRSTIIKQQARFWDYRNPTDPCSDSWVIENHAVDPLSFLRTTTLNQQFRRGGTIGLNLYLASSRVAFKCPFSAQLGDITHPDWRPYKSGAATANYYWPPPYNAEVIGNHGYTIYLGTPL